MKGRLGVSGGARGHARRSRIAAALSGSRRAGIGAAGGALLICACLAGSANAAQSAKLQVSLNPKRPGASTGDCSYGGMISIELKGGLEESRRFLERCRIFALAESLGGVESLIEHPAIMTHASVPAATRAQLGISDSLCRLSVGVEDVADLRADLEQALKV